MERKYTEGEHFRDIDKTKVRLSGDYEDCVFENGDLSEYNLSGIRFTSCRFINVNLSNVKITGTTLNDIHFTGCKMLGLLFDSCSDYLFTVTFDGCQLDFSSFQGRALKKAAFRNCSMRETDLTDADLSEAVLDGCNLYKAVFFNTNLEGADLRSAHSYSMDPERNRLKKARFSYPGVAGLLDKYGVKLD